MRLFHLESHFQEGISTAGARGSGGHPSDGSVVCGLGAMAAQGAELRARDQERSGCPLLLSWDWGGGVLQEALVSSEEQGPPPGMPSRHL